MDIKSKIILISGPTASGKSSFALKVAKKVNGEIVNADSMQVYKQLNILTARPKKKDQKKTKHHLYGFQSVTKKFSTGQWLKLVKNKIKEIQKKREFLFWWEERVFTLNQLLKVWLKFQTYL